MRTTTAIFNTTLSPISSSSLSPLPHPVWPSPLPYLFGGMVAMVILVAFSVLILVFTNWKNPDNRNAGEDEVEIGDSKNGESIKVLSLHEDTVLVIMAGDQAPTFLATPVKIVCSGNNGENLEEEEKETAEAKQEGGS